MNKPRTTLEQWKVLQAVVDYDGFAQAAAHLHRSQSAISYSISKLQDQLGIPLLTIEGRKSQLTEAGTRLLRLSRHLISEASDLENIAASMKKGWEPEIQLVVDAAFPTQILTKALQEFSPISRGSRVQLREVVLSGADEALLDGSADLVIGGQVPIGFLGEPLLEVAFLAVAHPDHPLHQLGRRPTLNDLRRERQLVIRDSGIHQQRDSGWLDAEQRWTVTSMEAASTLIKNGLGFGWLPEHRIAEDIAQGQLKKLALKQGMRRCAHMHLIFSEPDQAGPATQAFAKILHKLTNQNPPHHKHTK